MTKVMTDLPPPEEHRFWLHYAIAMFCNFPRAHCGIHSCRRARRCGFWEIGSRRPTCLTRLQDEATVTNLSMLADILFAIHDGTHPATPSGDPGRRIFESVAIEVMDYALPHFPDVAERFRSWRARYDAPPAPPPPAAPTIDAGAMAREMRAELKRMGIPD